MTNGIDSMGNVPSKSVAQTNPNIDSNAVDNTENVQETNYFASEENVSANEKADVSEDNLDELNEMVDKETKTQSSKQEEIEYWQNYAEQSRKAAEVAQRHTESLERTGILGMVADLFTGGAGKVTEEISQLDGNSTDEEIEAANRSIDERENTEKIAIGVETSLLAAATGGLAVGAVGATGAGAVALGGLTGAATNVGARQLDHATNQVEGDTFQDADEIVHDAAVGAVAGASGPVAQAISGSVSGAVGAASGLTEEGVVLAADGTADVGATVVANVTANASGQAVASGAVAGAGYVADTATDKNKEFAAEELASSVAAGAAIGGAFGAVLGAVNGYTGAVAYNRAINPYNLAKVTTAEEVGKFADKQIGNKEHRIATAGYSAPPEGYEDSTKEFLGALDKELGSNSTAYVTSPTADKGSIDAITSEVGGKRVFYTTCEDYVEYINPDNFPETIDTKAYSNMEKYVLPNADEYSRATAEASNAFLATGGRNATVSDFTNAINKGNKAVVLNNSSITTPAWGAERGRVENASKYIAEQLSAFFAGEELPYPEVGGFTKEFMTQNADKLKELVRIVETDGTSESVQAAASEAAKFLESV